MQKILIGVNCVFYSADEVFRQLLSEAYGYTEEYLDDYFCNNLKDSEYKHFRTCPKLHNVILSKEIDSLGNYIIGEEYGEIVTCKIIEIPDDVNWHIDCYECGVGEYVCEDYKTWS